MCCVLYSFPTNALIRLDFAVFFEELGFDPDSLGLKASLQLDFDISKL